MADIRQTLGWHVAELWLTYERLKTDMCLTNGRYMSETLLKWDLYMADIRLVCCCHVAEMRHVSEMRLTSD